MQINVSIHGRIGGGGGGPEPHLSFSYHRKVKLCMSICNHVNANIIVNVFLHTRIIKYAYPVADPAFEKGGGALM